MSESLRIACVVAVLCYGVGVEPVDAQVEAELEARIDSLLAAPDVESLLASFEDDFMEHLFFLVPDLDPDARTALAEAAAVAFDPGALRINVARSIATEATDADIDHQLDTRRSGATARLESVIEGYEPSRSFAEFSADLAGLDRARLQLMASLSEATGSSELDLVAGEALRQVAHQLVNAVGGQLGDFVPMADEAFEQAYRDRTLTLALESMYRLEPAPDELVRAVIDEHRTLESRRYGDLYLAGVVAAIGAAGEYMSRVTAPDDPEVARPVDPTPADPAAAPMCQVELCGFLVEWDGPEPGGGTRAYGAPGDLERFVFQRLASAGYYLTREAIADGLTLRLRPRSQTVRCEVISGTNNRRCLAVGQVRVEFVGSYPGHENPNGFTVRNRCRANEVMAGEGMAALVAARIHYEITTFPGDERRVPSC